MLLGGITKPIVAEVIFTAALNSFSYPSFSISGPSVLPIADAEAIADPVIAPIIIADTILIKASPPGIFTTKVFAKLINRFAIPPCVIS